MNAGYGLQFYGGSGVLQGVATFLVLVNIANSIEMKESESLVLV